jgi:hypothetical protein
MQNIVGDVSVPWAPASSRTVRTSAPPGVQAALRGQLDARASPIKRRARQIRKSCGALAPAGVDHSRGCQAASIEPPRRRRAWARPTASTG